MKQTKIDAPLGGCLCSILRGGFAAAFAVGLGMLAALPDSVRAQQTPAEVYGPFNAVFLPDGPGLIKPAAGPYGAPPPASAAIPSVILDSNAKWTLAFWFHSSDGKVSDGTMLLAGIGDPAAADARFIAMQGDRLALWLGQSGGKMIAADSALNASDWHL